jgi:hypothetical protein
MAALRSKMVPLALGDFRLGGLPTLGTRPVVVLNVIIARSGKASGSQQEHPAVRRIASSSEATSRSDVPAA